MKSIAHVVVYAIGLVCTASAIRHVDELPFWDYCRPKITHLSRVLGDYDTIFIGSSRFNTTIIPGVFDARMRDLGLESKSFNLGLRGLRPHDFQTLIDWLIAQRSGGLKRVFVELYTYDQYLREASWMTGVKVELHSPSGVWARLVSNAMSHHEFSERMAIYGHILAHTIVNYFRVGQAGRIVRDCVRRAVGAKLSPGRSVSDEGFEELAVDLVKKRRADQHLEWRADPAEAVRLLERRKRSLCPDWMMGGFNLDAFRSQVAQLRGAGIDVAYVVMPQIAYGFYGRDGVVDAEKIATVLKLDSPNDDPDIYDLSLWFDSNHLLRPGADLVSRRIAEKYAASRNVVSSPK